MGEGFVDQLLGRRWGKVVKVVGDLRSAGFRLRNQGFRPWAETCTPFGGRSGELLRDAGGGSAGDEGMILLIA